MDVKPSATCLVGVLLSVFDGCFQHDNERESVISQVLTISWIRLSFPPSIVVIAFKMV